MQTLSLARLALAGFIGLGAGSIASADGVRIVDRPDLGSFTSIQVAIDAATDGDTLLVASGTYAAFSIEDKSLSLIAVPGANALVSGTIEIVNLAAGKTVLVSGLVATGETPTMTSPSPPVPTLLLAANAGHVRIQSCTLLGAVPYADACSARPGGAGVEVLQSERVVFADCALRGAEGDEYTYHDYCSGGDGGRGLTAASSNVALYDCEVRGGPGGDAGTEGGRGGGGASVEGGFLLASGSSFTGGHGGDALDGVVGFGGDGGDGLVIVSSVAELVDSTHAGGPGGVWVYPGYDGEDGQDLVNTGGTVNPYPGPARKLTADVAHGDATAATLTFEGALGDRVFVILSRTPAFGFDPALTGQALVPFPFFGRSIPHAVAGPTGTVAFPLTLPDLGEPDTRIFAQGFVLDATGTPILASPLHLVILDRHGLPDCDGNGTNDYVDAVEGTAVDGNFNLVPDACEPDCNTNGVPDGDDIFNGTSPDCTGNGIPDECDIADGTELDCNGNGIPDTCDVASGASSDVNGNGVPDECEGPVTLFVDAAAAAGGDGTQASPFRTVGAGVAGSQSGDTVLVLDGLYIGAGNRDIDLGGRDIVVRSQSGPQNCIIDCETLGRAFRITSGETATIEGFTIRGGRGDLGGGIRTEVGRTTIRGCRFMDCRALGWGGAIFSAGHDRILECIITDCSTSDGGAGGGIYMRYNFPAPTTNYPILRGTVVTGCSSTKGGGVGVSGSHGTAVSHCTISGNTATDKGGGIYIDIISQIPGDAGFTMTDSRIFGNAAAQGGGICIERPLATRRIANCTVTGNTASVSGGALYTYSSVQVAMPGASFLDSSILWNNSAPTGPEIALEGQSMTLDIAYCDVQGGQGQVHATTVLNWGPGNIDADPLFNGPHLFLLPGSPCIDAGNNAAILTDLTDIDQDGDAGEEVPLDAALQMRRRDVTGTPDTGNGPAPVVDMGAVERQ